MVQQTVLDVSEADAPPVSIGGMEFILSLFSDVTSGYVEICALAPEGARLYPHTRILWRSLPVAADNVDMRMTAIHNLNAQGYSCYFGAAVRGRTYEPEQRVNEKTGQQYTFYPRGKATDATWITALWADVDEPGRPGYERLISTGYQPSIVVSTGGGWHGYWLLTEPLAIDDSNRDSVKRVLKGLALAVGSDTKVADLARIMRIPDTMNTKPGRNNARCEVVDYIPMKFYYPDLEVYYAPYAPKAPARVRRQLPTFAADVFPQWVNDYLATGAPQGERNARLYSVARFLFDIGKARYEVDSIAGGRAAADGLDDVEIARTITSAERAERNASAGLPRHMLMRMAAADQYLESEG